MRTNLALSADFLRSSEDIFDGKLGGKIFFFAECRPIKIIFMRRRIAGKISVTFALVFRVDLSEFCDSLEKLSTFKSVE